MLFVAIKFSAELSEFEERQFVLLLFLVLVFEFSCPVFDIIALYYSKLCIAEVI